MGRKGTGSWVMDKVLVLPEQEDLYIYKRPATTIWQYFLSIPNEGEERRATCVKGDPNDIEVGQKEAKQVALDRKLEVMSRHREGLLAKKVKRMFDYIEEFLNEQEQRIADFNKKGSITRDTFRMKLGHLRLLQKYYKNRNTKLENLDYKFLWNYPTWRQNTTCDELNPIAVQPPKKSSTICTELTTLKAYFQYLFDRGYISRPVDFRVVPRENFADNRRDYLSIKQYKQTINRVRAWSNDRGLTPTMSYNKKMLYQAILVMSNSALRIGSLRGLIWRDIEVNDNLSRDEQKVGHIIKVRKEICKTGTSRSVQTPTVERFNTLRDLAGIPKQPKSKWPHIPMEFMNQPVFSKFNHHDKPLGMGTWNRGWKEIKELCYDEFWFNKNITWYSFRHTAISFAVGREVPMLTLAQNCGTGIKYIEQVYYHHEAESKATWNILNKNRDFTKKLADHMNEPFIPLEDVPVAKM